MVKRAKRLLILDIPNERSSHSKPTYRGGGLAIVFFTLVGLLIFQLISPGLGWPEFFAYLSGTVLIAIISWFDDLKKLPSLMRFAIHSLGAFLILAFIGYWQVFEIPILGQIMLVWLGIPVTFLWITGLTNAYNFMDGIDGIAGGQGVVAGMGWAILGWLLVQPVLTVLGILLAAASLGFLLHNWHPAKIFMGDVGSAFLGFTFAVLPLIIKDKPEAPVWGFLLVWPFVFDAAYTFLRRLLRKEAVFLAHRSHLYQRLVITGLSHQAVSSYYIVMSLAGLVCAVGLVKAWPGAEIGTLLVIISLSIFLYLFTHQREKKHLHQSSN